MKGIIVQSVSSTSIDTIYKEEEKRQGQVTCTLYKSTSDKNKIFDLGGTILSEDSYKVEFNKTFNNAAFDKYNSIIRVSEDSDIVGPNRDIVVEKTLEEILKAKMEISITNDEDNRIIKVCDKLNKIALDYSDSLIIRGNSAILVCVIASIWIADTGRYNKESNLRDKYSKHWSYKEFTISDEKVVKLAEKKYKEDYTKFNTGRPVGRPKKNVKNDILNSNENIFEYGKDIDLKTTLKEESEMLGISEQEVTRLHRGRDVIYSVDKKTISVEDMIIESYLDGVDKKIFKPTLAVIAEVRERLLKERGTTLIMAESEAEKIIRDFLRQRSSKTE